MAEVPSPLSQITKADKLRRDNHNFALIHCCHGNWLSQVINGKKAFADGPCPRMQEGQVTAWQTQGSQVQPLFQPLGDFQPVFNVLIRHGRDNRRQYSIHIHSLAAYRLQGHLLQKLLAKGAFSCQLGQDSCWIFEAAGLLNGAFFRVFGYITGHLTLDPV